jgi:hypothetical protein
MLATLILAFGRKFENFAYKKYYDEKNAKLQVHV